jgi:hypothetical protein
MAAKEVKFSVDARDRMLTTTSIDRTEDPAMSWSQKTCRKIVAEPVLGGLHHIYKLAA